MYSAVKATTMRASGILTRKMLGQPTLWVSTPPIKGPSERPAYTVAVMIPMAFPRSPGGKTAVTMAIEVENTIAPPSAWMILPAIIADPDHETAARRDPAAKRRFPRMKNFLRPCRSASRPNGTMKIAAVRRYAEVTQPSVTASISNEALIAGRATLRDETVYGTRNEAREQTMRRIRFRAGSFMENCGS